MDLNPQVIGVQHIQGFQLEITFSDGTKAVMDFTGLTQRHGIYESLKNDDYFRQVHVNDAGTIEWPGELDLCPDVLYHLATGAPLPAGGWLENDPGIKVLHMQPAPQVVR